MKIYHLNILPQYFDDIIQNKKRFEIRKKKRDYKVDDIIYLHETVEDINTKHYIKIKILYTTEYEQKENYIVFGFSILDIGVTG